MQKYLSVSKISLRRHCSIARKIIDLSENNNQIIKSSCVNARGIPTAAYQVLHLLSCAGRYPIPGQRGVPHPCWGVPHLRYPCDLAKGTPCGQTDGWMDRHVSKHYLPVVLRARSVKTKLQKLNLNFDAIEHFRHWYSWSPVTATDWGNSRSSDLTSSNCWNLVTSCYKSGDVIAGAGQVGIVTGKGTFCLLISRYA